MSYGVGVSNIFDVLSEEGEQQGSGKKVEKVEQKAAKPAAAPAQKPAAKPADQPKKDATRKFSNDKKPAASSGSAPTTEDVGASKEERKHPAERRSEGKSRVPREGQGSNERPPKQRTFDRRSGTGHPYKGENKKGGAGKGNWGSQQDEEKAAVEAVAAENATEAPAAPKVEREETEEEKARNAQLAAEREKEEKMMTVEEYMASRKKVAVEAPKERQANEGADATQWKGYAPLKREEDDETFLIGGVTDKKKNGKAEAKEHEPEEKRLDASSLFSFSTQKPFQAETRGGRGGGRGSRGGRGGSRGGGAGAGGSTRPSGGPGRGKQNAPTLDTTSFPELSAAKA